MELGQWRENRSESAFAGGMLCDSSLEWNNHEALLVPRSPSCKDRIATMDIIETATGQATLAPGLRKAVTLDDWSNSPALIGS